MHSERRRGKSRSRILYWFRTPPGVRVGRAALDDEAIRQIEQLNPSIEFDWPRILKGQGEPPKHEPKYEPKYEPKQTEKEKEKPEQTREVHEVPPEPVAAPVEPEREIPAHARIGVDGVARLRSRYREILTRVSERVTDPVQQEELKARAERLNPDSWVTDQEVVHGLEEYESTLAALQSVVGRKRRRRRRGRRPEASAVSGPPDAGTDTQEDELNGAEDEGGDDVAPSEVEERVSDALDPLDLLDDGAPEKPEL